MALLDVRNLEVHYGGIKAVKGISFAVEEGEMVCLIGANGAGKTTTLKAIARMLPSRGELRLRDERLDRLPPHALIGRGLALVPEGRGVFARLSGGEQQMLAIGRALMGRPKLLLLDEPSMGLAPLMVQKVFEVIRAVAAQGVTILLVEQNAKLALETCGRGYVMESGTITVADTAAKLLADSRVRAAYLGE